LGENKGGIVQKIQHERRIWEPGRKFKSTQGDWFGSVTGNGEACQGNSPSMEVPVFVKKRVNLEGFQGFRWGFGSIVCRKTSAKSPGGPGRKKRCGEKSGANLRNGKHGQQKAPAGVAQK